MKYWIVFQRQLNQPTGAYAGHVFQHQLNQPTGEAQMPIGPGHYTMAIVPTIFRCETALQACQAAAKKTGGMGTYLAVEGFPWGIDMVGVDGVTELGDDEIPLQLGE
jgi:hypothetical protein